MNANNNTNSTRFVPSIKEIGGTLISSNDYSYSKEQRYEITTLAPGNKEPTTFSLIMKQTAPVSYGLDANNKPHYVNLPSVQIVNSSIRYEPQSNENA